MYLPYIGAYNDKYIYRVLVLHFVLGRYLLPYTYTANVTCQSVA